MNVQMAHTTASSSVSTSMEDLYVTAIQVISLTLMEETAPVSTVILYHVLAEGK